MTDTTLAPCKDAVIELLAGLNTAETGYHRDYGKTPDRIIVLAGHELFTALHRALGHSTLWSFNLETGELRNCAVRAPVVVARAPHAAEPWSYTAVLGNVLETLSTVPATKEPA